MFSLFYFFNYFPSLEHFCLPYLSVPETTNHVVHYYSPVAVPSTVVTRRVALVCGLTFRPNIKRSTDPESSVTWYAVAVKPMTVARV